jgi:hypothetical protein
MSLKEEHEKLTEGVRQCDGDDGDGGGELRWRRGEFNQGVHIGGGEKKRERIWVENFEGRELREIEKRKNEFINGMVIESLSQIHESPS